MGFLGNGGRKDGSFNTVDRKEYFLEQKSELLKGVKNGNFLKGLVYGSSQKMEHFIVNAFLAKHGRKDRFSIF